MKFLDSASKEVMEILAKKSRLEKTNVENFEALQEWKGEFKPL